MDIAELKNALFEGGVVGAGGAGFPTHAKLSDQAETVILNCAECEPLIKVDRQLVTEYVNDVLAGMQMFVETMGAKEGIVAIKKSYTASLDAVREHIGAYKIKTFRYYRIFTRQVMKLYLFMKQQEKLFHRVKYRLLWVV